MEGLLNKTTEALVAKLKDQVPDLIAIYQFGSQVQGEIHKESDIDLAVLAPQPLSPVQRFDLEQELAVLAHQDVDLVDLKKASTVLRMQIMSTGRCLLSTHDTERDRFETLVFLAYARLNEERREILKSIQKRGRVYAR